MHTRARSMTTDTQYKGIRRGAAVGGSLLLAVLFSLTFGMFGGICHRGRHLAVRRPGLDGSGTVCTVVVANNLDNTNPAAPVASAVVTTTTCFGAADAAEAGVCTETVTNYTELVTDINQCNYAGKGGGATLECDVTVVNTIIGDAPVTPVPVTVNQCNELAGRPCRRGQPLQSGPGDDGSVDRDDRAVQRLRQRRWQRAHLRRDSDFDDHRRDPGHHQPVQQLGERWRLDRHLPLRMTTTSSRSRRRLKKEEEEEEETPPDHRHSSR